MHLQLGGGPLSSHLRFQISKSETDLDDDDSRRENEVTRKAFIHIHPSLFRLVRSYEDHVLDGVDHLKQRSVKSVRSFSSDFFLLKVWS